MSDLGNSIYTNYSTSFSGLDRIGKEKYAENATELEEKTHIKAKETLDDFNLDSFVHTLSESSRYVVSLQDEPVDNGNTFENFDFDELSEHASISFNGFSANSKEGLLSSSSIDQNFDFAALACTEEFSFDALSYDLNDNFFSSTSPESQTSFFNELESSNDFDIEFQIHLETPLETYFDENKESNHSANNYLDLFIDNFISGNSKNIIEYADNNIEYNRADTGEFVAAEENVTKATDQVTANTEKLGYLEFLETHCYSDENGNYLFDGNKFSTIENINPDFISFRAKRTINNSHPEIQVIFAEQKQNNSFGIADMKHFREKMTELVTREIRLHLSKKGINIVPNNSDKLKNAKNKQFFYKKNSDYGSDDKKIWKGSTEKKDIFLDVNQLLHQEFISKTERSSHEKNKEIEFLLGKSRKKDKEKQLEEKKKGEKAAKLIQENRTQEDRKSELNQREIKKKRVATNKQKGLF
ncbi:MAG: hypothetical protein QRY74_05470 [Chlamydia sp.]